MYDIIYSINVHESPECVHDLLDNIFAFHPQLSIGIILNTSHTMFDALNTVSRSHVWLFPIPLNKQWCSYGIFLGYIQNFCYLVSQSIEAKYYILLASNCMFHRPVSLEFIQEKYAESDITYILTAPMPPIPEWCQTYQLSCNPQFFQELNIPLYNSYHEGAIFPWHVFQQIVSFKDWTAISSRIRMEFAFEEVLFPSLHRHFTGRALRSICTMKHIDIESIHEIQNPCIKTVPRIYDNEIRRWLRNYIQFYSNREISNFRPPVV